jgi:hypothetical protein
MFYDFDHIEDLWSCFVHSVQTSKRGCILKVDNGVPASVISAQRHLASALFRFKTSCSVARNTPRQLRRHRDPNHGSAPPSPRRNALFCVIFHCFRSKPPSVPCRRGRIVSVRRVAADDQLRGGPAASPAPGQLRPMLDAPALPLLRVHLHQAPRHGRVLPASVPRRGRLHSGVDLPRRPRVARRLPRRPVRPHLRQQHRRAAAERRRLVRVQGCHQVRVAPGRRRQVHARSLPRQPRQQPVDGRIPRQPDAPPLLPTSRP